jgi:hypothetical protein
VIENCDSSAAVFVGPKLGSLRNLSVQHVRAS